MIRCEDEPELVHDQLKKKPTNIRKPIDVNFVLGFVEDYSILLNGRFGKLS